MIYQAKNIANYFWLGIPGLLILDCFILGFDFTHFGSVAIPTLVGGGIGILVVWAGNKDAGLSLTQDSITLTKTATDSTTINKSDIESYHVGKEGGKTTVTVNLKDKSSVSVSSFALQLDDFETVMKNWMSGQKMEEISVSEKTSNPKIDTNELSEKAADLAGKAKNKLTELVSGKSESDLLTEKLTNVNNLKEKGILSEEEYAKKKAEILDNFN